MRVQARDGGGKSVEGLLTVTINRNLQAPVFIPDQYRVTIKDNEPLASSFTQVIAEDKDEQVSSLQSHPW